MDQQLEIINIIPEPNEKVYSVIQGLVLDEQEQVLELAEVFIQDQTAQTDENGFFKLEGFFPSKGTSLRVQKTGYFDSNGTILPQADAITKVNIVLEEKVEMELVESGRIINHQIDQVSVLFPEDVFVHQDGSNYQGLVRIDSKYFDPTDPTFADSNPGFFKSANLTESKILFPFGLLKLEIRDEQARSLSINQEVEIIMDIPTDLLATAPTTISMWHLDKETGLWEEEGTAELEGNSYKGKVTHFSDWVFALELDYVLFSGQITKEESPFPFANVEISYGAGFRFSFNSDEKGNFSTPIIIGSERDNVNYFETIDLEVKSNCGTILFEEKNIPPPIADFTREIDVQSNLIFTITGQVICTEVDNPVSDAYVILQFEDSKNQEIIPVDEQGKFEMTVEECELSEVILVGYDIVNLNRSEPLFISRNSNDVFLNVCEPPLESTILFHLDEEVYSINNCTVEIIDSITYWHYQFKAIDSFPDHPDVEGKYVDYTIDIFQPKEGEGPVPTQLWQFNEPTASDLEVPYQIAFEAAMFEILDETEDLIIVHIPVGGGDPSADTSDSSGPDDPGNDQNTDAAGTGPSSDTGDPISIGRNHCIILSKDKDPIWVNNGNILLEVYK